MSHPLIWPSKVYFYPIGNTSAVSVTADLPPEEPANVLLLGCGDPRNILHTVATETHNRPLDFTCCDIEPAVLARNVLLFSLIIDGRPFATIWNVFFHFRLDGKSHQVLIEQCKKLIDLSESPQKWRDSTYGGTLKMATDYTLAELRRHWELYTAMPNLPPHRLKAIDQDFSTQARNNANAGRVSTVTRSLGPLVIQGWDVVAPSLTQYWRSGTTFSDGKSLGEATILNPTFVYSLAGETCSVHYGTDPLIPFHIAPAFAEAKTPTLPQVVKFAKAQFDVWCTSFAAALSKPHPPIVRFMVGDAMAACHALRVFATTGILKPGIPVAQWKTHLIQFSAWEYVDGPRPAPTSFNVIHTSNLEDHIGLLNVLIPAAPLLSPNSSSVLYTESLLALANDPTKEFIDHLKADVTIMGLILGICPVDYLCGFTSRSNTHELLNIQRRSSKKKKVGLGQFQQIVAWRSPTSCDPIASQTLPLPLSFDPCQMATLFYDVYQSLFAEETSENFWNKHGGRSRRGVLLALGASNITACYTREAFVLFLKSLKDRLQPSSEDWRAAVTMFDARLLGSWSKSNMETMHYQDLLGQLHRYGLHTSISFYIHRARKIGPFASWPTVPELMRIVLVVPRHELHVLEDSKLEEVGTPPLHCEIWGTNCSNLFTSVHAAFGRAVSVGTEEKPQMIFEEDVEGWKGKSSLVLSFTAPSNLLTELDHPDNLSIAFSVRNTPAVCNCKPLLSKLGLSLRIFSAKLMDSSLVHVLPEPPLPAIRLQAGPSSAEHSSLSTLAQIGKADRAVLELDDDCEHVSTIAIRVDVTDEASLELFTTEGSKAVPEVEQVSACVVKIALESRVQHLMFPFPVVGSQHRLRLARKSRYIEVLVPTSRSFMEEGMKFNPYPVIRNGETLFPWSIHRVKPSSLPIVKVNSAKDLSKWLAMHVGSMMSDRERKLRKKRKPDALMFVKDTINTIFAFASGQSGGKARRIFQLVDEEKKNSDTIFFVDKLRLDGASHTVVCDGYVFAGTPAWVASIMGTPMEKAFGQLLNNPEMVRVPIFAGEMQGWKQLIPSFVERCRTWTHTANCEYKVEGNTIPLSEEMEHVPICSCGQGKEVEGMLEVPLWKPFAPYVTRIAISPLFAVSYLESVGRAGARGQGRKCEVCRGRGKGDGGLKTCSGCKKVRYCSDECQKKDWKAHKPKCKA